MTCKIEQVCVHWHPWVTASGVCFSRGMTAQTQKPAQVEWTCGPGIRLLSIRFFWKWHAQGFLQRADIISEPSQCRLFRNQEMLEAWGQMHFSCYLKGFERVSYGQTLLWARRRWINRALHLSEHVWGWWDAVQHFISWGKNLTLDHYLYLRTYLMDDTLDLDQ